MTSNLACHIILVLTVTVSQPNSSKTPPQTKTLFPYFMPHQFILHKPFIIEYSKPIPQKSFPHLANQPNFTSSTPPKPPPPLRYPQLSHPTVPARPRSPSRPGQPAHAIRNASTCQASHKPRRSLRAISAAALDPSPIHWEVL